METVEYEVRSKRLEGMELFLFTDNSVAESAFFKGTSTNKALFDLIVRLKRAEMEGGLKLHVIHVSGKRMIAQGTNGLSRGDMLERVMGGADMLSFVPLDEGAVERFESVLPWVWSWCGNRKLQPLTPEGWFEKEQGATGGKLGPDGIWIPEHREGTHLWAPPPAAADVAVEELICARHKRPGSMHIFVCPRLMMYQWRKQLFKVADVAFEVPTTSSVWPHDMLNLLLLPCASLLSDTGHGDFDDPHSWWNWSENCVECGATRKGVEGLFCANFCYSQKSWMPCRQMWCGKCYKVLPGIKFHVIVPTDKSGFEWVRKGEENRFLVGRAGDHVVTPFQCDLCIFRILTGRDPRKDGTNDLLLACIRQANLDALWGWEPSTVYQNSRLIIQSLRLYELVRLKPNYPHLGPFPLEDVQAFGTAVIMLLKSIEPGKYAGYTQFETIRKFCSAYSNAYLASALGVIEAATMGKATAKAFLTKCPTQSLWFEKFCLGCVKRMGQIVRQDLAISVELLLAVVFDLQREAKGTYGSRLYLLIRAAAFCVIAFAGSFRGHEVFLVELDGLLRHLEDGKRDTRPHVVVTLLGRFKTETGLHHHLTPLAAVTASGIQVRKWVDLLVALCRKEGRKNGPEFCNHRGEVLSPRVMEGIILDSIQRVKDDRPELVGADVNVHEDYGISRSFRRGSNTRAQNVGVSEPDINAAHKWRDVEKARGRKPAMKMSDHYLEVKQSLPSLLRYSTAL